MTTIEPHSPYATLINVFVVEPDRATELAALLSTSTDEVMRHMFQVSQHPPQRRPHSCRQLRPMGQRGSISCDADESGRTRAHDQSRPARHQLRPQPVHRRIGARGELTLEAGGDPLADLRGGQLLLTTCRQMLLDGLVDSGRGVVLADV